MTHSQRSPRIFARLGAAGLVLGLAATSLLAATSHAALATDIPTRLVLPAEPTLYPDPICLGCKIITKRATAASGADDGGAVLRVTYVDDAVPTFEGDVVLTVFLLGTSERRTVTLDGVVLTSGHTVELHVDASEDWDWDEVESVWVELVLTT